MEVQEYGAFQESGEKQNVIDIDVFEDQLDVFKALGSETRLKIIHILRENFKSSENSENGLDISTLALMLNQTEANVSAQCKRLEKVGLITIEYRPGTHGVRKICKVDYTSIIFRL